MIVNRHNNFERLTNFDVRIGMNKNNLQNPTCHDRVRTVGQGQALRVQCDPPIPGRYVSVQMFGQGILTLCEVTVYSRVGELVENYKNGTSFQNVSILSRKISTSVLFRIKLR